MEQKTNRKQNIPQTFQKKIKHTTYVVNVHFLEEANAPNMADKLFRLIAQDQMAG